MDDIVLWLYSDNVFSARGSTRKAAAGNLCNNLDRYMNAHFTQLALSSRKRSIKYSSQILNDVSRDVSICMFLQLPFTHESLKSCISCCFTTVTSVVYTFDPIKSVITYDLASRALSMDGIISEASIPSHNMGLREGMVEISYSILCIVKLIFFRFRYYDAVWWQQRRTSWPKEVNE